MRYVVASVDLIGNQESGWEVNDLHQIGSIDISEDVLRNDQLILDVLNENEYTDNTSLDGVVLSGDDDVIEIIDWETGRPLLHLIRQH